MLSGKEFFSVLGLRDMANCLKARAHPCSVCLCWCRGPGSLRAQSRANVEAFCNLTGLQMEPRNTVRCFFQSWKPCSSMWGTLWNAKLARCKKQIESIYSNVYSEYKPVIFTYFKCTALYSDYLGFLMWGNILFKSLSVLHLHRMNWLPCLTRKLEEKRPTQISTCF